MDFRVRKVRGMLAKKVLLLHISSNTPVMQFAAFGWSGDFWKDFRNLNLELVCGPDLWEILYFGMEETLHFLTDCLPTNRNWERGLGKEKLFCLGQLSTRLPSTSEYLQQKRFCLHSFSARQTKWGAAPFSVHLDWVGQTQRTAKFPPLYSARMHSGKITHRT